MSSSIIIVGASTRAAAFSALRAGIVPYCIDLFADVDLQRRAHVVPSKRYPNDLPALAQSLPTAPWMYTGALENHTSVIEQISRTRRLLGNLPLVVRQVRRPDFLAEMYSDGNCRFPEWRTTSLGLPMDGSWLRKAYRSAGGVQLQRWTADLAARPAARGSYWQRRVEGTPCSAVYVAAAGHAMLLGATEQLIGASWTGATGFRYAGSLGPLPLSRELLATLQDTGNRLADRFGLVGLFGVDFIAAESTLWLIEVNPRVPASVEILEAAGNFSAVAQHVDACTSGRLPAAPVPSGGWFGKAIWFSPTSFTVGESLVGEAARQNDASSYLQVADIPACGSTIKAGSPVLTVLSQASGREAVLAELQSRIDAWRQFIAG